jgi:hypothetical protein
MDAQPLRQGRDYFVPAVITLVLYFAGLYIVGLLANLYFIREANHDEDAGVQVSNAGCLDALFWLAMLPIAIAVVALAFQGFSLLF